MSKQETIIPEANGKDVMLKSSFDLVNHPSESGIKLQQEDIIMPRLSLVQPSNSDNRANKNAGNYHFQLTDDSWESVNVVFFKNTLGRIMFDPDRAKAQAICGSSDRIKPSERFDPPQAASCGECKFSRPRYSEEVDIGGGVKKPKCCDQTIPLMGCFEDNMMPFLFTAKRTGATPIREFLSSLEFGITLANTVRKVKGLKPLSLHNYVITLTAKEVNKKGNRWFIPQLKIAKQVEDENFNAVFDSIKSYDFDKGFEDVSAEASEPEMDSERIV